MGPTLKKNVATAERLIMVSRHGVVGGGGGGIRANFGKDDWLEANGAQNLKKN